MRQQTIEHIADVSAPYAAHVDRAHLVAAAHVISGIGEQLGRWWMTQPDISLDEVIAMYLVAVEGAVRGLLKL